MSIKFFPFINKPFEIKAFTVLIICLVLNIMTLFFCYRMVEDHTSTVDAHIFEHNNKKYKSHPWLESYDARLDLLEEKVHKIDNY